MKTMSIYPLTANDLADASTGSAPAPSFFSRLAASFRELIIQHRQRRQLAGLDSGTLRDLGVEPDEIGRIHAGSEFTPRAWR